MVCRRRVAVRWARPILRRYPKLLDSTSDGSTLTFKMFQPIVWAETAPTH